MGRSSSSIRTDYPIGMEPSGAPPIVPDHVLLRRIGRGSYGEVWLARNLLGTWRAVKVIHRESESSSNAIEREFSGIQRFEPVSRACPGLVHVLQVGKDPAGRYFYCVMELADDACVDEPWQDGHDKAVTGTIDPANYFPKTLSLEKHRRGRLPAQTCIRIATRLAEALQHLHRNHLLHRDIKPSNIIFVDGEPKLADIGLVAAMNHARSYVGTEGYIPPEGPNSPEADLYGLGKVLYEISTGKDRQDFPEPLTLIAEAHDGELLSEFNAIVLKACHPDIRQRYRSAGAMIDELLFLERGRSVRKRRAQRRCAKLVACLGVTSGGILLVSWLFEKKLENRIALVQQTNSSVPVRFNGTIRERPVGASPRFVDLSRHYNASLVEAWHPGPAENTLSELPSGIVTLAGTDFDVRGLVQLSGAELRAYVGDHFPQRSSAIRVTSWVKALHFLHGAISEVPYLMEIGKYHVRYVGGRKVDIPIKFGVNVGAIWQPADSTGGLEEGVVAWEGSNPAVRERNLKLRLYKFSWENPHPGEEIEAVHFISAMRNAAPFLVALTADEAAAAESSLVSRAEFDAVLQAHAQTFQEFPATDRMRKFTFPAAPLQIGQTCFQALRLRTPAIAGDDLLWAISLPADFPEARWYILPVIGAMKAGFEDWWHLDEKETDTRQIRVQHLAGKKLQPDTEYLLWFASAKTEFPEVELQLKFIPSGSANPNKPAELLKALQLGPELETRPAHRHYCLGAIK